MEPNALPLFCQNKAGGDKRCDALANDMVASAQNLYELVVVEFAIRFAMQDLCEFDGPDGSKRARNEVSKGGFAWHILFNDDGSGREEARAFGNLNGPAQPPCG